MDNNENILKKYKRAAHYLNYAILITFWVCVIGSIAAVVALAVMQFLPDNILQAAAGSNGSFSLTMDGILTFRQQLDKTVNIEPILKIILLMGSFISAISALILRQIFLLLKTVEKGQPFDMNNSKRISIIGITLVIGGFVVRAIEVLVALVVITTFDIRNIELSYKADSVMILIGLLVLVLAGIFKYGSYLQQEYDATV